MVCGFEFAVGAVVGIGLVVKTAIGQRTAEALVEKQEQERDLDAFARQAISVTAPIAFQKGVTFQLTQIVAELVQALIVRRKLEGGEDGGMNLFGSPAANGVAAVQEDLQ